MSAEGTETASKRERQKQRREQKAAAMKAQAQRQQRMRLLRNGGLVAVAVAAVFGLAVLIAGGDDDSTAADAPAADVQDQGSALPPPVAGADPARGQVAPSATGEDFAGEEVRIGQAAEGAQAIAFMAHWCPHCQDELPEVADWVAEGSLPDDVELVAVSTNHDPARPNWPPDEWFEREQWPGAVLADPDNAVADAYGLSGTPYWVFVDAAGAVTARLVGRIGQESFEEAAATASAEE